MELKEEHFKYITNVVASVTKESQELVGKSLKSVLERIETIESVKNQLTSLGIYVNTSTVDIINQLADKWNGFTEDEKLKIAVNIGGVYNMSKVLTLFNNYEVNV